MTDVPLVGVVVVNHDGGHLTLRCLESLLALSWPADRLRIVLVDNASTDGVAATVKERCPDVTVSMSPVNLGFAGGCNAGFGLLTDVDYVALLNNDAVAEDGWLEPLVHAVAEGGDIGAASSKVLFDGMFVEVGIETPTFVPGRGDSRSLGLGVSGARVDGTDVFRRAQLVRGFWGAEHGGDDGGFQWSAGTALLRLPLPSERPGSTGALLLSAEREKTVTITCGDTRVEHAVGPEPRWCEVPLAGPSAAVVNSAGVLLLEGGYGADRGYLEVDRGQYNEPAEVFAWSGASVLLSRRYLDAVGLFDERFFLYYEDFDLAWRGRLRGWRHVYVPRSVARHVHGAAAGLGSRLQDHHVERNRLITLVRDAPAGLAAAAVTRFVLVTLSYVRRDVLSRILRGERPSWEIVGRRLGALGAFARRVPGALADRVRLRRRRAMSDAQLRAWMVKPSDAVVGTEG
jgi:GT2 family glycosyltransferase